MACDLMVVDGPLPQNHSSNLQQFKGLVKPFVSFCFKGGFFGMPLHICQGGTGGYW
jgi:hypothetical protein